MRLGLLHLSDMHIRGEDDPLLKRASLLATAARSCAQDAELCIVLVTGDVAFSGKEQQYLLFVDFLDQLKQRLGADFSGGVRIAVVPGNHDCDFGRNTGVRDALVTDAASHPGRAADPSIVDACTIVQDPFFQLRQAVAPDFKRGNTGYSDKLYYEYVIPVDNGTTLRVLCANTAWLSKKSEIQGGLTYPAEAIPELLRGDALVLAAFHHPYNWLEANAARAFRKRVEAISDIVLTGHEHDSTFENRIGSGGETNTYIEGGVLQSDDEAVSNFNFIIIDTQQKQQKLMKFEWDGDKYTSGVPVGATAAGWQDLQVNRLRLRSAFDVNDDFRRFLDDPGIEIQHPSRSKLSLNDLFVYPDFREITYRAEQKSDFVAGEDFPQQVVSTRSKLLITGDTLSGKTSLAKEVFKALLTAGRVPVLLGGYDRPPVGEGTWDYLERTFVKQYSSDAVEAYRQLDKSERAIILDDYDRLQIPVRRRAELPAQLSKYADTIIVLANDLATGLLDLATPEAHVPFAHFRIQPFGYVRRNSIVGRWIMLRDEVDLDASAFAHQLSQLTDTLDTLFGRNFVPAYPAYILSILQAAEATTPIDTRASTHGYFYELLIKAALARGRTRFEYDVLMAYLANLAYGLFERRIKTADRDVLKALHENYAKTFDIRRDADAMIERLVSQGVLLHFAGAYEFKYKYMYYYFVAAYIRDHLKDDSVRAKVSEMCKRLYLEEDANIMLFLAHVSRDDLIISELLSAANVLYAGVPPAALDKDVEFLKMADELTGRIVYKERDPDAVRREMLAARDAMTRQVQSEHEPDDASTEFDAQLEPVRQVNAAMKTLQIVGQVLKNFPGSLEAGPKAELARACYELGLRCLATVLDMLEANEEAIAQEIVDFLRNQDPDLAQEKLKRKARETIVGLGSVVSFGIVKRVSQSVGSPDLGPTYERVLAKYPDVPSVNLIDVSISLDHTGSFPDDRVRTAAKMLDGKQLAWWILKRLVVQHFDLFPVDYRDKQRFCMLLGIPYESFKFKPKERKLLKP